jgi:hypothetical protein
MAIPYPEGVSLQRDQSALTRESADLLQEAMNHPGVADVMSAYGQYENVLAQTEAYLCALNTEPSFSVTDSTSHK